MEEGGHGRWEREVMAAASAAPDMADGVAAAEAGAARTPLERAADQLKTARALREATERRLRLIDELAEETRETLRQRRAEERMAEETLRVEALRG